MIDRFHNILILISCGHSIDNQCFEIYCKETAELYVNLYPWYYMPPSVHKLLIHGPRLVKESILPMGQLSEEELESSHKYIKSFRRDRSRKCSRTHTNEEIWCLGRRALYLYIYMFTSYYE